MWQKGYQKTPGNAFDLVLDLEDDRYGVKIWNVLVKYAHDSFFFKKKKICWKAEMQSIVDFKARNGWKEMLFFTSNMVNYTTTFWHWCEMKIPFKDY